MERDDEEAGEVIIDKIAGSEAVYDNTAGAIVAVRDKIARGEAIRDKTAEEGEAILEAVEESRLYWRLLKSRRTQDRSRIKTFNCL